MRIPTLVGLLALCVLGHADEFLSIPTAAKVPYQGVRLDYASSFNSVFSQAYADYGIGKSFETTLRFERPLDMSSVGTFDFAYNYISPIADLIPGVSLGVQDALGVTPEGRRYYLAITSRQTYSTITGDVNGDVTIGVLAGHRTAPFLGFDLPISNIFRLVSCYDGFVITAGVELRPTQNLGLRLVAVDGRPQIGLNTLKRF